MVERKTTWQDLTIGELKHLFSMFISSTELASEHDHVMRKFDGYFGVSSIKDEDGKSYWWNTIDKSKKYQVRKYEYDRALQDYSVISYKIKEI